MFSNGSSKVTCALWSGLWEVKGWWNELCWCKWICCKLQIPAITITPCIPLSLFQLMVHSSFPDGPTLIALTHWYLFYIFHISMLFFHPACSSSAITFSAPSSIADTSSSLSVSISCLPPLSSNNSLLSHIFGIPWNQRWTRYTYYQQNRFITVTCSSFACSECNQRKKKERQKHYETPDNHSHLWPSSIWRGMQSNHCLKTYVETKAITQL